jgi:hypothetical protein
MFSWEQLTNTLFNQDNLDQKLIANKKNKCSWGFNFMVE